MISTLATAPVTTLDLREIAPRERHATIFGRFDALQPGQSLQLLTDHDPQPLRHRFEERFVGRFEWTTLEAGPALWRVRITRIGAKASAAAGDSCCSGGACCG